MSGILHFVLVDIRAACELLDVIHSLDKSGGEVTIEHYDVVREEIAYREKDSFWINGISVINAVDSLRSFRPRFEREILPSEVPSLAGQSTLDL